MVAIKDMEMPKCCEAIEALEQQTTDAVRLISLDDIMTHFPKANFNGNPIENKKAYPYWKTDITGLISILKSIPMVNPCVTTERPKGKWIITYPDGGRVFKCNQCNKYADIHYATDYCPNCGAEMSGGGEDE